MLSFVIYTFPIPESQTLSDDPALRHSDNLLDSRRAAVSDTDADSGLSGPAVSAAFSRVDLTGNSKFIPCTLKDSPTIWFKDGLNSSHADRILHTGQP